MIEAMSIRQGKVFWIISAMKELEAASSGTFLKGEIDILTERLKAGEPEDIIRVAEIVEHKIRIANYRLEQFASILDSVKAL